MCLHDNRRWAVDEPEQLLRPEPLDLEMGVVRHDDDSIVVAIRNLLPNCTGKMIDWWFSYFQTTQHIHWWHPLDHVQLTGWDSNHKPGQAYIGATVKAIEALNDLPPTPATLKFHHPNEIFNDTVLTKARCEDQLSAAVYARIGFGKEVDLDAQGDPMDGEMLHLYRDTDAGCLLRSRFYLGKQSGFSTDQQADTLGRNLMAHCYSEFTYLSHFLPSLYYAESGRECVRPCW